MMVTSVSKPDECLVSLRDDKLSDLARTERRLDFTLERRPKAAKPGERVRDRVLVANQGLDGRTQNPIECVVEALHSGKGRPGKDLLEGIVPSAGMWPLRYIRQTTLQELVDEVLSLG